MNTVKGCTSIYTALSTLYVFILPCFGLCLEYRPIPLQCLWTRWTRWTRCVWKRCLCYAFVSWIVPQLLCPRPWVPPLQSFPSPEIHEENRRQKAAVAESIRIHGQTCNMYTIYTVYIYICIIMHIISYNYEYIGHASLSSLLVSQRITLCGFETFGYPFRVRGKAEDQHGNMKLFNLHYFRRMSKPVCLGLR